MKINNCNDLIQQNKSSTGISWCLLNHRLLTAECHRHAHTRMEKYLNARCNQGKAMMIKIKIFICDWLTSWRLFDGPAYIGKNTWWNTGIPYFPICTFFSFLIVDAWEHYQFDTDNYGINPTHSCQNVDYEIKMLLDITFILLIFRNRKQKFCFYLIFNF